MPRQTTRAGPPAPRAATAEVQAAVAAQQAVRHDVSWVTDDDLYLFNEGSHFRLWEKLGSHPTVVDGVAGTHFAIWAPNAEQVSVIGDFNGWNVESHPLRARGQSGVWEGFVPGLGTGAIYKFHVVSRHGGYRVDKADPFALHAETPPKTGSIVWDTGYTLGDGEWMARRAARHGLDAPLAIYEVHLGTWMRVPDEGNRSLNYREIAPKLA